MNQRPEGGQASSLIEANRDTCHNYIQISIGLISALVPVIGYEQSAAIAKEALKIDGSGIIWFWKKSCLPAHNWMKDCARNV